MHVRALGRSYFCSRIRSLSSLASCLGGRGAAGAIGAPRAAKRHASHRSRQAATGVLRRAQRLLLVLARALRGRRRELSLRRQVLGSLEALRDVTHLGHIWGAGSSRGRWGGASKWTCGNGASERSDWGETRCHKHDLVRRSPSLRPRAGTGSFRPARAFGSVVSSGANGTDFAQIRALRGRLQPNLDRPPPWDFGPMSPTP